MYNFLTLGLPPFNLIQLFYIALTQKMSQKVDKITNQKMKVDGLC